MIFGKTQLSESGQLHDFMSLLKKLKKKIFHVEILSSFFYVFRNVEIL